MTPLFEVTSKQAEILDAVVVEAIHLGKFGGLEKDRAAGAAVFICRGRQVRLWKEHEP
jgi:hypothetical protein